MNKRLYMTAMNMVRQDCEQCPHIHRAPGKCPSEVQTGAVGHLKTCAMAMYLHLLKKPTKPQRGAAQRGPVSAKRGRS